MTYRVKEIFYTLQGEGAHAGRPAVFCRFTSCNLWTGREHDRHRAICRLLRHRLRRHRRPWRRPVRHARTSLPAPCVRSGSRRQPLAPRRFVVCTGGEPLLQLDEPAIGRPARGRVRGGGRDQRHPPGSARPRLGLRQPEGRRASRPDHRRRAQARLPAGGGAARDRSSTWTSLGFCCSRWTVLRQEKNTQLAVEYCLAHPQWRLSLQTHKYLGIA